MKRKPMSNGKDGDQPRQSQSELIRAYVRNHPAETPRQVHAGMHEMGQPVSLSLVQTVVYQTRRRTIRKDRKRVDKPQSFSIDTLRRFCEFSDAAGVVPNAKQLVELLS